MLNYYFLLVLLPVIVNCCMRTAEPATTLPPPTTKVTPVTTTAAPQKTTTVKATTTTVGTTTKCSSCKVTDVGLFPNPDAMNNPMTGYGIQPTSKQTCNTLVVTCAAPSGSFTFMEFNDSPRISNPGEPEPVETSTLTCTAKGWQFTFEGNSIIVTKVYCSYPS